MKARRQIKFMRRYVKIVEGGQRVGSDVETGKKMVSDQRFRWKCGKLMDLASVGSGNDEV